MTFLLTPYAILCACAALIATILAAILGQQRIKRGGTMLALSMTSAAIWATMISFEYAAVGIENKIFWAKLEYIGVVSTPVFFLLFAIEYNGLYKWLTKLNIALLFIIPLITLGLAATNEHHGLIWSGFEPVSSELNLVEFKHGPFFWFGVLGYSYLAILLGIFFLIWATVRFPKPYRLQTQMTVAGAIIPWLMVNIAYMLGLVPAPGLDLSPIAFVYTGTVFAWGISHYHMLDLAPIAREVLVETMTDGMLVLNMQKQIVDINPSGIRLFEKIKGTGFGQHFDQAFAAYPELINLLKNTSNGLAEIELNDEKQKFLELNISPLRDQHKHTCGKLIVIHDITERKNAEEVRQQTNERLRTQLIEIENLHAILKDQAIHDVLTGLFNRRYLDDTLNRELGRAAREHQPVSLIMLDVDHFKKTNDLNGHHAGDELLRTLGTLLTSSIRVGDIACRYGGDEFMVVMPGISTADAYRRAEQLRATFENTVIRYQDQVLNATLSGGVATFPDDDESLSGIINLVDQALYKAKEAGKNCIVVGNSEKSI